MKSNSETEPLILRDNLALDRTVLANERTLLSYVRTALALLITGLSLLKFFPESYFRILAVILIGFGLFLAIIGLIRFLKFKASLARFREIQNRSREKSRDSTGIS